METSKGGGGAGKQNKDKSTTEGANAGVGWGIKEEKNQGGDSKKAKDLQH